MVRRSVNIGGKGARKIYKEFWVVDGIDNGIVHREDGPAIVWDTGDSFWYQDGRLHREDGPAIIRKVIERKQYFLKGQELTKEEFNKTMAKRRIQKIK